MNAVPLSGGGIGGLALALVLKTFPGEKPLTVDLYEAEDDFTEVGAGITIPNRPRPILYKLGLEPILKPMIRHDAAACRKSDTTEPFIFLEPRAYGTFLPYPLSIILMPPL